MRRLCFAVLALGITAALILFRIYGIDTVHATRGSIWWPERGRNLIPPTATGITLRRDLLDHYAVYTVAEKDLNTFLDTCFSRPGKTHDPLIEKSPAKADAVGKAIGPLGWIVTKDSVVYTCTASNGGTHLFYHDTKTGRTFQSSAHW